MEHHGTPWNIIEHQGHLGYHGHYSHQDHQGHQGPHGQLLSICIPFLKRKTKYIGRNAQTLKKLPAWTSSSTLSL